MKGFEPMLAKAMDGVPQSDGYVMEAKMDGWRLIAGAPPAAVGDPWLETRTGNRVRSVPYVARDLRAMAPDNTIVDGELIDTISNKATVSRGSGWNRVQHIASSDREHRPTAEDPGLMFVVFDLLVLSGEDVRGFTLRERRDLLEAMFARNHGSYVELAPQMAATEENLERLLSLDFEGAVVKRLDSRYLSGRRASGAWYKIKPQDTEDVVFTGTYAAEAGSKYDGTHVGGFTFRRANGYNGRAAGMDDALRAQFNLPGMVAAHVGKVMEIAHHGETVDGALRSPQFVRFRDPKDKGVADVLAESGETLERRRRGTTSATKAPAKASTGSGRTRNYGAMGDEKLLRCLNELSEGEGDAYDRCLNGGSGDPAADLALVEDLVAERGLVNA